MNNPEGYVLVQVKQLAQWREWANNVAAWSTKADRSSEVARLKASISSAMVSATQPTASAEQAEAPVYMTTEDCMRIIRAHAPDDLKGMEAAFRANTFATRPTASNAALCPTCGANTASDNPNQWCACPKTTASNAGERVPAGWSISIGDNGEVLVSAPGCEPGAAWIKNQGPLSQRLLYALASALASKPPAGEQKRCSYCDDTGDVHSPDGEWRGRCTCPAGQPEQVAQDGLTLDDAAKLETAIEQFSECGETSVDYEDLMRFANMGLLECVHFNVPPSADDAIRAARARGEGERNG